MNERLGKKLDRKIRHVNLKKSQVVNSELDILTDNIDSAPLRLTLSRLEHAMQRDKKKELPKNRKDRKEGNKSIVSQFKFVPTPMMIVRESVNRSVENAGISFFSDKELKKRINTQPNKDASLTAGILNFIVNNNLGSNPHSNITINNNGDIKMDHDNYDLVKKNLQKEEPDIQTVFKKLLFKISEDEPYDLALISTISNLSSDNNKPNVAWIMPQNEKYDYRKRETKKLIDTFGHLLKDIHTPPIQEDLYQLVNNILKSNELNFTQINKYLAKLIYDRYSPGKIPSDNKLKDFIRKNSGISESIFALRKTFFISLMENLLDKRGIDKKGRFQIEPSLNLSNKLRPKISVYHSMRKEKIFSPSDFTNLSSEEIFNQFVFFVIEQNIKRERSDFSRRKITVHSGLDEKLHSKIELLDFLLPGKKMFKFNGIEIPINIELNGNYISYYKINRVEIPKTYDLTLNLNETQIANTSIPVEIKK